MKNRFNIGIYGISGSGKSTLISELCKEQSIFQYFEGSKIIENILDDNIENFKLLKDDEKYKIREEVVSNITKQSIVNKHTIIDGHYSFIKGNSFEIAITKADIDFFSHIFHLDISNEVIKERQLNDKTKRRNFTINQISQWKHFEKLELQKVCKNNNINFINLTSLNILDNINRIQKELHIWN